MRLLLEVCHEVELRPVVYSRDSVARVPTVTTRSATATKTTRPSAFAMQLPRRAAFRAFRNKLFTSGTCAVTLRGFILYQLQQPSKQYRQIFAPQDTGREAAAYWEALPR